MPRKEANAPTERIIVILDDVAALEDYCQELEEKIIELHADELHLYPRRPSMEAVVAERARQGLMLQQTRRKREYARRISQLGQDHEIKRAVSISDIEDEL